MQDVIGENKAEKGSQGRARPVALALVQVACGRTGAMPAPGASPTGSGRVPALWPIFDGGQTPLQRLSGALQLVARVQQVGILPHGPCAEEVQLFAEAQSLRCIRGGGDLLSHFVVGLRELGAGPDQVVVRVTAESPLLCPEVIDAAIETLIAGGYDYVTTDLGSGVLPMGLDVEATYARLLYDLDASAEHPEERERVTWALYRPPTRLRVHELSPGELGPALERSGRYYASFRLALSTEEDRNVVRRVALLLDRQVEPGSLSTLLRLLDQHPEWRHHHLPMLR